MFLDHIGYILTTLLWEAKVYGLSSRCGKQPRTFFLRQTHELFV